MWRFRDRLASEKKCGWCRATSARPSISTTRSGTAGTAAWMEAGRSRRGERSAEVGTSNKRLALSSQPFRFSPPSDLLAACPREAERCLDHIRDRPAIGTTTPGWIEPHLGY